MKKFLLSLALTVVLSGCVGVTEKPITTSSGRQGFAIECNGTRSSWAECAERAGQICGKRGYKEMDRGGEAGTFGSYNAASGMGFADPVMKRSIVIECRR